MENPLTDHDELIVGLQREVETLRCDTDFDMEVEEKLPLPLGFMSPLNVKTSPL